MGKRVRRKECFEAYSETEKDCATDEIGRRVWLGQQKGLCVRCQHLVEAYRRLRERCPMLQDLRLSLQSTLAELTELVDFPHLAEVGRMIPLLRHLRCSSLKTGAVDPLLQTCEPKLLNRL